MDLKLKKICPLAHLNPNNAIDFLLQPQLAFAKGIPLGESVATLRISFRHSGAMPSKSYFLILCNLRLHHDIYHNIRVEPISFE